MFDLMIIYYVHIFRYCFLHKIFVWLCIPVIVAIGKLCVLSLLTLFPVLKGKVTSNSLFLVVNSFPLGRPTSSEILH